MLKVLKYLLEDEKTSFAPYSSMKAKHPETCVQAVKFQTLNMNQTRVVILENISEDMVFFYIGPHIVSAIPGDRD
jgi:hypothetical protein